MRTGLCYFKTAETVLTCTFSYICFKVIECSTVSVCVWVFRMSKIKIYFLEMFSQVAWDRHSVYHKFLVVRWCWKLLIVNNWTSCCTWDLLQCSKQYLYNIIFPPAPPTKNKKAFMKKDCDQQHKGPFGLNDSISATILMLRTSCWVWWILWCSLWMKRFYLWLCCFYLNGWNKWCIFFENITIYIAVFLQKSFYQQPSNLVQETWVSEVLILDPELNQRFEKYVCYLLSLVLCVYVYTTCWRT